MSLRAAFFGLRLRDPAGELLPGQDDPGVQPLRSSVYAHLGGASHASFDLVFPFAEPGVALQDYVTAIRPHLPVARVAWDRFRHYTPNKAGTAHVIRKVNPNW